MKITVQDIINAARKNGLEQNFNGNYFDWTDGEENPQQENAIRACFMGQAAINLGISVIDIDRGLNKLRNGISRLIVNKNDNDKMSFEGIANFLEYYLTDEEKAAELPIREN